MSQNEFAHDFKSFVDALDAFAEMCYNDGYYDGDHGKGYKTHTAHDFKVQLPIFHTLSWETWVKIKDCLLALRETPIVFDTIMAIYDDFRAVSENYETIWRTDEKRD